MNSSLMDDMKQKAALLDSLYNTIRNTIATLDNVHVIDSKWNSEIQQNRNKSFSMKRNLHSLQRQSMKQKLLADRLYLNMKLQDEKTPLDSAISNDRMLATSHSVTPSFLSTPTNDERSILSTSTINLSIDLERIMSREKHSSDTRKDMRNIESLYRQDRMPRSIPSSVSTSRYSPDELLTSRDISIVGKLHILHEIYPSVANENLIGIPLAFLGIESKLRIRIDWTRVRYPLSAYHIELIIDLLHVRPSFVRDIPKVTKFNLYRSLTKTVSGYLFFDHRNKKAEIHQCGRKKIRQKFTIYDLAAIHQREFHIISYNAIYEQRFINLFDCLFEVYHYKAKSNR